jgi:hypothetical protein
MNVKLLIKHKIRSFSFWLSHVTDSWVASPGLVQMYENKDNPDYEGFDKAIRECQIKWGKHDSHIEGLKVARRLHEFKKTNNIGI